MDFNASSLPYQNPTDLTAYVPPEIFAHCLNFNDAQTLLACTKVSWNFR
ncbi:MAG: hypothetical protein K0S07_1777, partial [Chlamydiales bacterium]|nr:hypothetical protein [Chlamydiales bacterium]